jgi:hypothetical protein
LRNYSKEGKLGSIKKVRREKALGFTLYFPQSSVRDEQEFQ